MQILLCHLVMFFQASLEQSAAATSRLAELEKQNTDIKVCNTYRYSLSQKFMHNFISESLFTFNTSQQR